MEDSYQKMIIQYWKDYKKELYKSLKSKGTLKQEAKELANLMRKEEKILTEQLLEKDGGQASMIASEIIRDMYLK
jgi:hypothetical protein